MSINGLDVEFSNSEHKSRQREGLDDFYVAWYKFYTTL
jgi:hypothetical protein